MKIVSLAKKSKEARVRHQINCRDCYFMFINQILSTGNYGPGKLKNYDCLLRRLGTGMPIVFGVFLR